MAKPVVPQSGPVHQPCFPVRQPIHGDPWGQGVSGKSWLQKRVHGLPLPSSPAKRQTRGRFSARIRWHQTKGNICPNIQTDCGLQAWHHYKGHLSESPSKNDSRHRHLQVGSVSLTQRNRQTFAPLSGPYEVGQHNKTKNRSWVSYYKSMLIYKSWLK